MTSVLLRKVEDDDLPHFFANQLDEEANRMAAFTAKDPTDCEAFDAHGRRSGTTRRWRSGRSSPTAR